MSPGVSGRLSRKEAERPYFFRLCRIALADLDEKRWEVPKVMTGQDALTLREMARRVGRDVHALLDAGMLDRTDDGRIHFPSSAVRVDFTLHKEVA
jgi:predicted transcriptional regulator